MIEVKRLRLTYPNGTVALDGVDLELAAGGVRAILGRSGSGKTTLLQCLARFLIPQEGTISLGGRELHALPEKELRQTLGVVFQDLYLFLHLNVLQNLTLAPVHVLGEQPSEARSRAMAVLERFGMAALAERYPAQISGGQAQRVAIARALLLEPEYLLLDEPTAALDVQTGREFGEWLVSLQEVTTFVLVTHDAVFARETAASGVLLDEGRVVTSGSIEEVLEVLEGSRHGEQAQL
jgi:polar amino acid transport system ATP-binding protein